MNKKKYLFPQNMKMADEVVRLLVLSYGPVSFCLKPDNVLYCIVFNKKIFFKESIEHRKIKKRDTDPN